MERHALLQYLLSVRVSDNNFLGDGGCGQPALLKSYEMIQHGVLDEKDVIIFNNDVLNIVVCGKPLNCVILPFAVYFC